MTFKQNEPPSAFTLMNLPLMIGLEVLNTLNTIPVANSNSKGDIGKDKEVYGLVNSTEKLKILSLMATNKMKE